MSLVSFILLHWDSIAAVAVFVVGLIVAVKRGYSKYVNEILFYLVTDAERKFGGGTGALKYAAVTTWIYDRLPKAVCLLFSETKLDDMIEDAVEEMQKYLAANSVAATLVAGPLPEIADEETTP